MTNASKPKVVLAAVEPLAVTVSEAALLLGISESTLRREVDTGDFPTVRFGTRVVIPLAAARKWLADHTVFPQNERNAS